MLLMPGNPVIYWFLHIVQNVQKHTKRRHDALVPCQIWKTNPPFSTIAQYVIRVVLRRTRVWHMFLTLINIFNAGNRLLTNYCVSHPQVSPLSTQYNSRVIHRAPLSSTYKRQTRLTVYYYYYFYTMLRCYHVTM